MTFYPTPKRIDVHPGRWRSVQGEDRFLAAIRLTQGTNSVLILLSDLDDVWDQVEAVAGLFKEGSD